MRLPHDNFFYHSNTSFGVAGDLHDEKKLMAEEQKLCRARARKFSLETKRRRKALEERQKTRDEQEKREREKILQQRRERVQDATERFQRGHLPPSQRRRRTFTRDVPNIDDFLSQLQGPLSCYTQQSSYLSGNSNINRSCTPSPQSSHSHSLFVVEAHTKTFLEQRMAFSKNLGENETTQEKQQNHSPQDSHVSDSCNSSRDSLENEDHNHGGNNLWCSHFYLLDSEKPRHASDRTSSAMRLLNGKFTQSEKQQEPQQKKPNDSEGPNNKMHIANASWGFTSEQTQKTETQPAVNSDNLSSSCEISSTDPEHFETNSTRSYPKDNINFTVTLDSTALDSSCPKQEALLDLRQQRVHDDRQLIHPSATEILLPAKNGNSREILFGAPLKPNIFLNESNTDNSSQVGTLQHIGKETQHLSSQKEPSASIINLNAFSNLEPTTEKPVLQHARLSDIQSDTLKCFKRPEEDEEKLPLSVVRLIKGILKKPSRYMSTDAACGYSSGQGIFAEQVALAIKDSVELTRAKTKDVRSSAIKKRVRWFDEVHEEKEQIKSKSSILSQSKKKPEDHKQSLTTVSGASKPGPNVTPAASTGYHFTKQAWADVGVQVSLSQERADEVKVLQSATRSIGPKAPWRELPARARAGPVSSRSRKGTVIRPQSATEVNRIAKTQGRIMVPRPPPRMEAVEEKMAYVTNTPYGMDHTCSVNSKQAVAGEQALHKDASGGSPYTHHVIRTDCSVMHTALPPSHTCPVSEGNEKSKLSSGHQETQGCGRRRGTVSNERGLCLDCTPTDEEISQLWHGVRSALVIKDAKAVLRCKAPESGRAARKPCSEQSRQSPGSGNRRPPPQPFQSSNQSTEPGRLFSNPCDVALTHEGVGSAAQLHLAEVHAPGRLEERDVVAAMETAQTQSPGAMQQQQHKSLTTISLEEQKILLSLEKLNHQLHCVKKHAGSNSGMQGLMLMDAASTREMKVTNRHKLRAPSANNHARNLKKS
ncbi:centrosomal protein of 126 kDa [Paralichthys olivaceus]|uniref:centrosomal protein of 126 kDa n=1 Tax=Paralichthys olivaceus TaxID=8255 RepID=UPI0037519F74